MARSLRIEYEGALYHVFSRGNARVDIYLNDLDRLRFMELLGNVCHRFNWLCHAYCLMGNHYHLLIETPEPNLSRGMRHLKSGQKQATTTGLHRYNRQSINNKVDTRHLRPSYCCCFHQTANTSDER
ncbi:MAG: transposase [Proteobacteria bacterium]|nr:transposase [Pseudomonadota bacterium]